MASNFSTMCCQTCLDYLIPLVSLSNRCHKRQVKVIEAQIRRNKTSSLDMYLKPTHREGIVEVLCGCLFPHFFVWASCFFYIWHFRTHTHTPLSHTHTHTYLCHTPSLTHHLPHTSLSHTTSSRPGTWRHLPSFCVTGVALMALGWLWWRAWAPLVSVSLPHFA